MLKKSMISIALIVVFICSGCTVFVRTNATPYADAKKLPIERLLAYTEKKEGFAKLTVTRDEGFMGSACYIGLVISGTLAARFDPGETAEFFLPSGTANMAVVPDPQATGVCSVGGWDPVPEQYIIKENMLNLYRISLGAYRRPRLLPAVY